MINLSNYKTINIKDQSNRTPLLCITETTVSFGKGALDSLGRPQYARLIVSENERLIILVACSKDDDDSFEFVKKSTDRYVRMKSRILHSICDKMSGLTQANYPYRVDGKIDYSSDDNKPVIIFDMSKARSKTKTK